VPFKSDKDFCKDLGLSIVTGVGAGAILPPCRGSFGPTCSESTE
jgi:hypothetical protein